MTTKKLFLTASTIFMVIAIPLISVFFHTYGAEVTQDDIQPISESFYEADMAQDYTLHVEESVVFMLPPIANHPMLYDIPSGDITIDNINIHKLSQLRGSDLSIEVAFQLYRVQAVLSLGMDLDTFFFGDTVVWINEYLYQWRRANNIAMMPEYDGPIMAGPDVGDGLRMYSVATQEYLFSLVPRCDEENRLIHIRHLLRHPHLFTINKRQLLFIMDLHFGISSFDELVAATPLYYLQTFMVNAGLTFNDIRYNWKNTDPTPIPGPSPIPRHEHPRPDASFEGRTRVPPPCEVDNLLEIMRRYDVSAIEALWILGLN